MVANIDQGGYYVVEGIHIVIKENYFGQFFDVLLQY